MILIGEKLNGSIPAVAKAIARRDADFIRERVRIQVENGADYLDCCASLEEQKELEALHWMIDIIQEVTDKPICIDSPSPKVCVEAMKYCRRPGLINSVSMEKGKIEKIFPAVAGTKWGVVALLCDNQGIPGTAKRRIEIFEEILEQAVIYHVNPEQLYIDPLVMPAALEKSASKIFSTCCRHIRKRFPGIHITSGLSNISFGMPVRKSINQAFVVLAMEAGMDSAILDLSDTNLVSLIYAAEVLLERDEYHLGNMRDYDGEEVQLSKLQEIAEAVEKGRAKMITRLVREALDEGYEPVHILNTGMIEAMGVVGERFRDSDISEPEMLIAARAMKTGIETLRPYLTHVRMGNVGTMILGTVAGDLHDIGKNLVAMMMESVGIKVIDLGIDVPAERFLKAIEEHPEATLVGCSALLTTTMSSLKQIVGAIHTSPYRERVKVMVGGAPITQEFADEIGADAYTPDAASAARKARELLAMEV